MYSIKLGQRIIDISKPIVMGVINLTDDSFYKESRVNNLTDLTLRVQEMVDQGASLIDLGAFSSRPGSEILSAEVQLERLEPAVELLFDKFKEVHFSIDTCYSSVVRKLSAYGPFIVNDISGFEMDSDMPQVVAELGLPYILMHMKGTPKTMQFESNYEDFWLEILHYFAEKVSQLRNSGVKDIILDPGFGFAKNKAQNFKLLKELETLKFMELPILVGVSRKSFIYKTLECTAEEALNGTTALNMLATLNGANILRVHDVKPAIEVLQLYCEINNNVKS